MNPLPRTPSRVVGSVLAAALAVPLLAACSTGSAPAAAPSGGPTVTASSAPGRSSTASSSPGTSSAGTSSAGKASPAAPSSSVSAVPAESAPPGDIPDNLAFVRYTNAAGHYSFTHPEGWAQTGTGTTVQFTDKLNGVRVDSTTAAQAPTVASARASEVARLQAAVPAFELRSVSAVPVPAGQSVKLVFRRNSDPDSVTGKVYRDEVEEYLVFGAGHLVRVNLFGPVGADNVDAYATMIHSLVIR